MQKHERRFGNSVEFFYNTLGSIDFINSLKPLINKKIIFQTGVIENKSMDGELAIGA